MISDKLLERLQNGEREAFVELIHITVQEALRALPAVNEVIMKNSAALHERSERFYQSNPDLNAHRPVVAKIIETLEMEKPGRPIEQLLAEAAPRAREIIKAQQIAVPNVSAPKNLNQLDDTIGRL